MCASSGTTILTTVLLSLWICRRKKVAPENSSAFPSKVLTFFGKNLCSPRVETDLDMTHLHIEDRPYVLLHTPLDYLESSRFQIGFT